MYRRLPLIFLLVTLSSPALAVPEFGYKIIDQKPQSRDTFVQGLQIIDGKLYVSSGGYGKSRLRRFNFENGELELERRVDPRLFAEGISALGDRVYLLTWRSRNLLIYSRDTLQAVERMLIPGEGWGLTHNGKELIYSDGSSRLYFISLTERRIVRAINVSLDGKPVNHLNELEWIDGRIWANVWQTNRIVIIDPATGKVDSAVNLQGILPVTDRRPDTDVLNGIAIDPADGGIWVTGKNWPWLYRIELVPKVQVAPQPAAISR